MFCKANFGAKCVITIFHYFFKCSSFQVNLYKSHIVIVDIEDSWARQLPNITRLKLG